MSLPSRLKENAPSDPCTSVRGSPSYKCGLLHEFAILILMTDLSAKRCVPCEKGVPALTKEQVVAYNKKVTGWEPDAENTSIQKAFRFGDFKEAIAFVNEVADIAEFEGHHPDIFVYGYRHVRVTLSTHAIKGLSENDFILAAKIDRIG